MFPAFAQSYGPAGASLNMTTAILDFGFPTLD
jgi:hypothetical protein